MKITRETEAYIQCCVEATEHERTGVLLGNVISPSPSLHCEEPNEYHFICPKLIIWDPMKRFELKCLKHNASLKPSFWFGKQSPWRQPRLLYDVGGNVLLISRYYVCSYLKSCRYLSIDERISKQLPREFHVPYILFHKSGCTKRLINQLLSYLAQGQLFTVISKRIQDDNFKEFCERLQNMIDHGMGMQSHELTKRASDMLSKYKSMEIFNAPSAGLLENFFMQVFDFRRLDYVTNMRSLRATSMTVSVLPIAQPWSADYKHIVIVFNELFQVISWAFVKAMIPPHVTPLFTGLRHRLRSHREPVHTIVIDGCCEWRSYLQSLFPSAEIKQDARKTIDDVTKKVPKRGPSGLDRCFFKRDFSLIFQPEIDAGNDGVVTTSRNAVILRNLDSFIKRWQAFGDSVFFNDECRSFIEALRSHITCGCFSGVSSSTAAQKLSTLTGMLQTGDNSVLAQAKSLGQNAAFAVLTVMFDSWNKSPQVPTYGTREVDNADVSDMDHIRNLLSAGLTVPGSRPSVVSTELFGFVDDSVVSNRGDGERKATDVMTLNLHAETVDDVMTISVAQQLLTQAVDLCEVVKSIENLLKIDVGQIGFQLAHSQLHKVIPLLLAIKSRDEREQTTIAKQEKHRIEHIKRLNLQCTDTAAHAGDVFACVVHELSIFLQDAKCGPAIKGLRCHLENLGLSGAPEEQTSRLVDLCISDLEANKELYMINSTHFTCMEQYSDMLEQFRQKNLLKLPDLLLKVLSNILRCPVGVVTTHERTPLVLFMPQIAAVKTPLLLHFTTKIPEGNFCTARARKQSSIDDSAVTDDVTNNEKSSVCRCGCNTVSKDDSLITCTNTTVAGDVTRMKYRTRCQCHKNGHDCTKCQCMNCGNEYNPPELLCADHSLLNCLRCRRKRKQRDTVASSVTSNKQRRKLKDVNVSLSSSAPNLNTDKDSTAEKVWSLQERCLIEVILSFMSATQIQVTAEHVTKMFDFVCASLGKACAKVGVVSRSRYTIEEQLQHRNASLAKSVDDLAIPKRNKPLDVTKITRYTESACSFASSNHMSVKSIGDVSFASPSVAKSNAVPLPSIHSIPFQASPVDPYQYQSLKAQDMTYVAMSAKQSESVCGHVDAATCSGTRATTAQDLSVRNNSLTFGSTNDFSVITSLTSHGEYSPVTSADVQATIAQTDTSHWTLSPMQTYTQSSVDDHALREQPINATIQPINDQFMTEEPINATMQPLTDHFTREQPINATIQPCDNQFMSEQPINATMGSNFHVLQNVPICKSLSLINNYQSE